MAQPPILFTCKFLCLHNYCIKYNIWDGYLYIIFTVIPTSWFIILLYIFSGYIQIKLISIPMLYIFTHLFILHPFTFLILISFWRARLGFTIALQCFSTYVSYEHWSKVEMAARLLTLHPLDVAPLPPSPATWLACYHSDNKMWRSNAMQVMLCPSRPSS